MPHQYQLLNSKGIFLTGARWLFLFLSNFAQLDSKWDNKKTVLGVRGNEWRRASWRSRRVRARRWSIHAAGHRGGQRQAGRTCVRSVGMETEERRYFPSTLQSPSETCCNREEPILTPCWTCFFYFNLCFLLLLFTKRILSIHNGLPQGTPPLCLNVKPKCLCSGKYPDPVHLWMAARKKKLTHPHPEAGYSRGYSQDCLFTLLPHLLPLSVL